MEKTKIAIVFVAVIGVFTLTVGLAFAHYFRTPYNPSTGSYQESIDEEWWTEMREHMENRWSDIENEKWFNEMVQYMEEHWDEVQNQPWFEEMIEYMEERGYYHYGYREDDGNYFGSRPYGRRGFGCWGW